MNQIINKTMRHKITCKNMTDFEADCTCGLGKKSNHKIYKNMMEWYTPEIDYFEMLENFRWTANPHTELLGKIAQYPLNDVMLFSHLNSWTGNIKQQMFQLWNKQCNDELAEILKELNPKLILDVCAGDGTLAKILSDRGLNIVAVDNYSWPFEKRFFDVQKMSYNEGLEKFQPDVVIGCWMPLNSNWTPSFRKTKSVKHYIQIGEGDGGCTGGDTKDRKKWPIVLDENIEKYLLCRTDWLMYNYGKFGDSMAHHSGAYIASRVE
jgi:hypothetical protein